MEVKRRTFIFATLAASAAVVVGWGMLPPRQRLRTSQPLPGSPQEVVLNGWIKLTPEGTAVLAMPRSEMGQGVHTALAMLMAEELDCGWDKVRIEQSPIDKIYGNVLGLAEGVPFRPQDDGTVARGSRWLMLKTMRELGFMMTGGSATIRDLWQPVREAAAMTRAALTGAAATKWGTTPDRISIADGVLQAQDGRRISLGEAVAQWGGKIVPVDDYPLKSPGQFRLIGQPVPRIDTSAKVDGSAVFAMDIARPGILSAVVLLAPVRGGSVRSLDPTQAMASPGVSHVVQFSPLNGSSGGVAVLAPSYWQAFTGLSKTTVEWEAGPLAALSSETLAAQLTQALDGDDGYSFWKQGDVDLAFADSSGQIQAEYSAPYLAHATMEPMTCAIEFKDGAATLWVPTQAPDFARAAAADVLGIEKEKVRVVVTYLGGGFGRRLEVDFVAQAAAIAKEVPGKAVRMIWSREDDMRHDFYRPACLSRFHAGFDRTGNVVAWRNVSAGPAIAPNFLPRAGGIPSVGPDKTVAEGAFDQSYVFPNAHVAHVTVDTLVPVGFWRAVGHSHQAFFKESFLDECAHAQKVDPVTYRARLLAQRPGHLAVLGLAASKSGWGTTPAPAADGAPVARGIALHESYGAIVAQVAEVSVDADKTLRVHRVVCAIDCGQVVNPNIVRQQMESAVVFGLSAALHGRIDFKDGQVQQSNFHDYPVLRMGQCPQIETHIVPSTEAPEGVGEPGLPPIAPAVANAVFVLTGQRLRQLPLALR